MKKSSKIIFLVLFIIFIIPVFSKYGNVLAVDEDTLDWGVDKINAEWVWGGFEGAVDIAVGDYPTGEGINVAHLDHGIDLDHIDLDDNYKGGHDYINNVTNPEDDDGHGTLTAGVICAEDNGENTIGVAPEVNLYVYKCLEEGEISLVPIYKSLTDCINSRPEDPFDSNTDDPSDNIHVINMSFKASKSSYFDTLFLNAYNRGIILVAASGNDEEANIDYPAKYKSVIAVGAVNKYDNLADWFGGGSNWGPEQELVAPGKRIKTLEMGGGTDTRSGTSLAAPHVTGVCALILSINPTIPPDELRELLHLSAMDLGPAGWDEEFGYGLVDAKNAVTLVKLDTDYDGICDYMENELYGTDYSVADTDGDGIDDGEERRYWFFHPEDPSDENKLDRRWEVDSDNDGIVNLFDPDSDNDGMPDGWEIMYFLNPKIPDASGDPDSDNLTNYNEYLEGTYPNLSDTDSDGIQDGEEVIVGEDGFITNPLAADSDGDGYNDYLEITMGFDPNDPSSYPQLEENYFDEDGTGIYSWTAIDYPYDKVQTNVYYDGKYSLFHYEDDGHYANWQLAAGPRLDLTGWDGITDLEMAFQFRCQSNYASSSVTQFRLLLYDTSTGNNVAFTNPTGSGHYVVYQSNRNGQTWISGYDSGWQSESFTIPAADLSQFAGTDKLVIRWGHYDAWITDWYQREYLDYLQINLEGIALPEITNGGFETGSLDPWITDSIYPALVISSSSYIHSGSYGCCLARYLSGYYYHTYIKQSCLYQRNSLADNAITFYMWSPYNIVYVKVYYSDGSNDVISCGTSYNFDSRIISKSSLDADKTITSLEFIRNGDGTSTTAIDDIQIHLL